METKLFINGLEVFSSHGLFAEEKRLGQKFIFDIECLVDYSKAMVSDEMKDSVSYADIADIVYKTSTENTFNLLERLAEEIVKNIFNTFPEIKEIKLVINKPSAPLKHHFKECGVNLLITREEYVSL